MVLESVMICLDNSEWMRNGDYAPTRLEAQQDAAGMICNDRTGSNPENTVGVLTMAGRGVDLLVSPTEDAGKILACFTRVTTGGKSDFSSSVQIAQLALKHRKNKNGSQRIIVFVGSPLLEETAALQKIGKQLKKNNVAVDVISFGELSENSDKLTEFINCTNSNDNCHLIAVPAGVLPCDAILSSPIMHMSAAHSSMSSMGGGPSGMGGGGAFDDYGGVDPSMDPELAMAIRASTEEARAQEEARVQAATAESAGSGSSSSAGATASASQESVAAYAGTDEDDEEALMQRALELSLRDMSTEEGATYSTDRDAMVTSDAAEEDEEDAALRMALELSIAAPTLPVPLPVPTTTTNTAAALTDLGSASGFMDPAFVSQLLGSVDVDQNDPLFQAALAQLNSAGASGSGASGSGDGGKDGETKNNKRKGNDGA